MSSTDSFFERMSKVYSFRVPDPTPAGKPAAELEDPEVMAPDDTEFSPGLGFKGRMRDRLAPPPATKQQEVNVKPKEAASLVDFDFITQEEGFRAAGYVPMRGGKVLGKSGVTIGIGVDLGQHDATSLRKAGVPDTIISKVAPYFGKKQDAAVAALKAAPLKLSDAEAKQLSIALKTKTVEAVRESFNAESEIKFKDLPPSVRTAIASVAFQYGSNLKKRTPKFWQAIIRGDFEAMEKELRNFGDKFESRRNREADLVTSAIKAKTETV